VEVLVSFFLLTVVTLGTSLMVAKARSARSAAAHIHNAVDLSTSMLTLFRKAAYSNRANSQIETDIFPRQSNYTPGSCPVRECTECLPNPAIQPRTDNPLFQFSGDPADPPSILVRNGIPFDEDQDSDGDGNPDITIENVAYNWSWGIRWCLRGDFGYTDRIGRVIEDCDLNLQHEPVPPNAAEDTPVTFMICTSVHWREKGVQRVVGYSILLRDQLGPP
jgi:hypothetical protein